MSEITYDDLRRAFDRMSDHVEEWQGLPMPLEEFPVTLHDRHPWAERYRKIDGHEIPLLVGGPDDVPEDEEIVNHWVDRRRGYEVYVLRGGGRAYHLKGPLPQDGAMDRLTFWLHTLGASDAWDVEAEAKARVKLRGMLSERQWRHYDLTGTFLETSKRSGVMYMFRRSRPTIALTLRGRDGKTAEWVRCLAVLCMHPIGYYQRTWAGCLVPSDDVIAHLLLCRHDEAGYWGQCNQHGSTSPEAGL